MPTPRTRLNDKYSYTIYTSKHFRVDLLDELRMLRARFGGTIEEHLNAVVTHGLAPHKKLVAAAKSGQHAGGS